MICGVYNPYADRKPDAHILCSQRGHFTRREKGMNRFPASRVRFNACHIWKILDGGSD